jgi:nucleotide-binding universal stress UspA family protein
VLLLGCSFTFGWAVSDDETWAWGLQARRPELDIRNHGTGGYSTLQAWRLFERLLTNGERPVHVIYGYLRDHAVRNVGDPRWLRALAIFSPEYDATVLAIPFCELEGTELDCHAPARYPHWPFREWSAAMTLAQNSWYTLRAHGREQQADEVTRRLVAGMAQTARRAGVPFSLLLLRVGEPKREAILPFARKEGIDVMDCDRRDFGRGERVPGDLHPNGKVHAAWAECVADALAVKTP